MKFLIITSNYPYKKSHNAIFVKQLVDKFVDFGHELVVISPQSITAILLNRIKKRPYKINYTTKNKKYILFSPLYISFSDIPILKNMSSIFYRKAVLKTIRREKINFNMIYSHFLMLSGVSAYYISERYKIPYFIALGEATFDFIVNKTIQKVLTRANGIIAVSTEIKERLLFLNNEVDVSKILVQPNGFDSELFHKMNKSDVRKQLGIKNDLFVVSFVGGFIHRKGTLRLSAALKEIDNSNIKAIFIGDGPESPDYKYIIHKGKVNHSEIVKYLNASDIFVLPTINEGSCNAIIEAIACGLPVVSSNKDFNNDILNEDNSIRIDTMSVEDIKKAILKLYFDKTLREKMTDNALKESKKFDLNSRSETILTFLESRAKIYFLENN